MLIKLLKTKIKLILLTLLAIFVLLLQIVFHANLLDTSSDSAIYADIARNMISGKGITSNLILPSLLTINEELNSKTWPPYYQPLYPIMIALSFLLFGIETKSILIASGFFYVATVPFLFILVKKLYSEKHATYASLWYIFFAPLVTYAGGGMSEPLFTFLLVIAITTSIIQKSMFRTGVVVALMVITKYQGWLVLASFSVHILLSYQKRTKSILVFFFGCMSVLVIRILINADSAYDQPSFLNSPVWNVIATDVLISSEQLEHSLTKIDLPTLTFFFIPIIKKLIMNLYFYLQGIFKESVAVLSLIGLLYRHKNNFTSPLLSLRRLTLILFLSFILFHSLTIRDIRYLYPLWVLLIVFATQVVLEFVSERKLYKVVFVCLFILIPFVTTSGTATSIERSIKYGGRPTFNELLGKFVREETSKNATIVSTSNPYITWYGDRKTLTLPYTKAELEEIDSHYISIDALVFLSFSALPPLSNEWQHLVDTPSDFGKFRFVKKVTIKPEENFYNTPAEITLYLKDLDE